MSGHKYTGHGWPCCSHVTGPLPTFRARCGGPPMCKRCAADQGGCPTRAGSTPDTPADGRRHRYTRHGWACCGEVTGLPPAIAKCGGPLVCHRCRRDVLVCPSRPPAVSDDVDFAALDTLYRADHPNLRPVEIPQWLYNLQDIQQQAVAVHHLLDRCGIARGEGFRADLDARMWLLTRQVQTMRDQLSRIAEQHAKAVDSHGGSDGGCRECGLAWPCPTHVWASTRRGVCDPWDDRFTT